MKYLPLLLLLALPAAHAANQTAVCPNAKTGDHAPACTVPVVCAVPAQANDMVRTIVAGAQVWEPYATLTADSAITPCPNGGWSTLSREGIPTFSSLTPPVVVPPAPPPVTPPPPPVVPPTSTQAVTVTAVDLPAATAMFPKVPNPECFTLSNGTQSVTACLPAATP